MYIDIRNKSSYLNGHIPGAININYIELLINHRKYLNKDKQYFIYCDSGNRSLDLVTKLNNLGYNCVNIDGGYNNYLVNK